MPPSYYYEEEYPWIGTIGDTASEAMHWFEQFEEESPCTKEEHNEELTMMESKNESPGGMVITTNEACTNDNHNLGIPQLNDLQIDIDSSALQKPTTSSSTERDEATADETLTRSPTGSSSEESNSDNDCADDEESGDDDDSSTTSSRSQATLDSTRLLLRQAQRRVKHQSVYEEVKQLRSEVSQYKNTIESNMRQKHALSHRVTTLEQDLSNAKESIHTHKQREIQWNEERATLERDFMNQLNDVCSSVGQKEEELMQEIVKRDAKIIELQNLWNEEEIRRMDAARDCKRRSNVVECNVVYEVDLDDEEEYSEFI